MRGLRWILACWLAFCWASDSFGQDPCVSTGNGLPYVSTNPNYVCEALDAFVYINVAQGYANPSDAAGRRTSTSAGIRLTCSGGRTRRASRWFRQHGDHLVHCPGPPEQLHLDGHHHGSSGSRGGGHRAAGRHLGLRPQRIHPATVRRGPIHGQHRGIGSPPCCCSTPRRPRPSCSSMRISGTT